MKSRLNIRFILASAFTIVLSSPFQTAWSQDEDIETMVAVEVSQVRKATLRSYVTGYGYIETEPAVEGRSPADAKIMSPVDGLVTEVKCYEGLHVKKGAVLFLLDSRIAESEVEKEKQAVIFAEKSFERQKELQESEATSEKTFQEIENQLAVARNELAAAQTRLSFYRILAPSSGIITKLNVRPGEHVAPDATMAEIADFNRLVAAVNIPVAEISLLKAGQPVEIKTDNSGTPVRGNVAFFSQSVDSASGTMTAYISLPSDTLLKPGQFVSARITCDERRDCLAVPVASVVKDSEKGWAISVVSNGRATRMKVKTGLRDSGLVEVEASGLKEGMTVVKAGAYGLPEDTNVRVIEAATEEN